MIGNHFLLILFFIEIIVMSITLLHASVQDIKERRVRNKTWLPMFILCTPVALLNYGIIYADDFGRGLLITALTVFMCAVYYIAARKGVFGGADAIALILITFLIPLNPLTVLTPLHVFGWITFPILVLINSVTFAVTVPVWLFGYNTIKRCQGSFTTKSTCTKDSEGRWIRYKTPFIVPLTIGFLLAIFTGI